MRKAVLLTVLAILSCLGSGCTSERGRIAGIKIYEYSGDYDALASEWQAMGINACFTGEGLLAEAGFRRALREHGISTYLIFPVFQNPDILMKDPSLYAVTADGRLASESWVSFVCPSRTAYRNARVREAAELVRRLDPDALSIDFIRHFVFWEMVYPDTDPERIPRSCYCDSCLARFTAEYHVTIPDTCLTVPQRAAFIDDNCAEEWDLFRAGLITSLVNEITASAREAKPGIITGIHAVPWRAGDFNGARISVAGQDLAALAPLVDYVSPMLYSQMLKRDPEWIGDVVREMNALCPGKILPSIQVHQAYIDRPFPAEEFAACLREALRPPSLGVSFFSWPLFAQEPERIGIVRELLR